ncbi:MAG: polymer-forming cytoskeletal protein [Treponema sp.]|mgnify:CR=1 FL=1|jgi:cytoskeletal protein CcmA (bactofilin family)|nr:polymer-forming cytoskeletal protein [Treponema sp.]
MNLTSDSTEKNFTVFGEETEFYGVLKFTDNLEIAGTFEGTIDAVGNLEFAKTAKCDVDSIKAESVVINGSVTGNIFANSSVDMQSGSKIVGDVTTKELRIDDGVDFTGKVTMLDRELNLDIFSYAASDFKNVLMTASDSEE